MPKPQLKIVPDTGFYIAAALQNGYARSYLLGKGSKFLTYQLLTSEAILLETQTKLETKFYFERPVVVAVMQQIRKVTMVVYPTRKLTVVRDPDDDKILECATEAQADVVVSFDKDLLSLKEFEGIKIIHPSLLQYMFPKKAG
jgi:putative PIN family toxin of toxin-antitoxin system